LPLTVPIIIEGIMTTNSRRDFVKKLAVFSTFTAGVNLAAKASGQNEKVLQKIEKFKKIDVHMHISSDASYLREVMDELNLKMNAMCNIGLQPDRLKVQVDAAVEICRKYPRYYAWCTTFGFERMYEPDWADRVKKYLKYGFDNGALAVKAWKEIGMQLKKPNGEFIQIDDPIFDPIFEYARKEGKTLFTHIGDPVDNWLYTGADGKQNFWYKEGADITVNRIGKFQGEVSWENLMIARDRMIAKNTGLKIIGCHLLSMPHDVDLVAQRLDRFPNLAVDTSLAVPYLMAQAREKVRSFLLKYQDRILYGLDESGGMIPTKYLKDMTKVGHQWTKEEVVREKRNLLQRYLSDFTYYFTDDEIRLKNYYVRGLDLPEEVLHKIFYKNAVNWIPGIDKNYEL
jgi:predicted TIM-barrel fold metal-dependent hydrolase